MTELIWEGKYRDGKRVAPVRIALPFQTVETVNESTQDRKKTLDLFSSGKPTDWRNRLIWGDKKYVLPSLLPEFAGKVNLIYIDPPFDTGADFSFTTTIPETDSELEKLPSLIEQKAYRDTWGRGLDSYLQWFAETAAVLRELLADDGSIYIHLDWHVGHYAKAVLDELFGPSNFRNEVVWQRFNFHADAKKYGTVHETIFFYTKGDNYKFNKQSIPFKDSYIESHFTQKDADGRVFRLDNATAPAHGKPGKPMRFGEKGVLAPPAGAMWRFKQENIDKYLAEGRIVFTKTGMPAIKRYLDELDGSAVHSLWTDIKPLNSQSVERVNYNTQKPEALLDRIVRASSDEGDLVLDCFGGSGTTASVAERLRRRWILCDLGRFAVHTTRKRLLGISGVKPFIVQNLGKYERQAWMNAEFETPADRAAKEELYRRFIVDLFRADPFSGSPWLHGVKNGRLVHVGAVDAPVTLSDVKAIAKEVWKVAGKSSKAAADILGWDFAFELNETAKQVAADANVEVRFRRIPREVLDKHAVEQGDIQEKDFFELRSLSTRLTKKKRAVTLELTDFIMPAEDLPDDVAKAVKKWSQWVDYWAVDWDYRKDTFHNEWQSYRTRDDADLELKTDHEYKAPGTYTIVIKVIDILGNDTTKAIQVEVA